MKCGETEKQIGGAEREFIQGAAINFLTPFRNFLEGDFKTILVGPDGAQRLPTVCLSLSSSLTTTPFLFFSAEGAQAAAGQASGSGRS